MTAFRPIQPYVQWVPKFFHRAKVVRAWCWPLN